LLEQEEGRNQGIEVVLLHELPEREQQLIEHRSRARQLKAVLLEKPELADQHLQILKERRAHVGTGRIERIDGLPGSKINELGGSTTQRRRDERDAKAAEVGSDQIVVRENDDADVDRNARRRVVECLGVAAEAMRSLQHDDAVSEVSQADGRVRPGCAPSDDHNVTLDSGTC
jgi:hypothetical protein